MAIIDTPLVQTSDGRFHGAVKIQDSKGNEVRFEVCAKERGYAEICLLSTLLDLKDDITQAYESFKTSPSIKRASVYDHNRHKQKKISIDAEKITRLYAAKKGETECKHIGDIDGFIPNIAVAKVVMLNGYGSFRIISFDTTIDIEEGFIIQNVIMKEE
jgi:hypothetical protein